MTAVEWLINEWLYLDQQFDMCLIDRNIYWDKLRQIQEQAKEMEKDQKKFFFECGRNFQLTGEGTFEEVYNETLKSE